MIKTLKIALFLFSLVLISSCRTYNSNQAYQELMEYMEKTKNLEKTYIIPAEYVDSKEDLEFIVKEKFGGEEVKIGAVGTAKYNEEKNCFENGKCWLKTAILNPKDFSEWDDLDDLEKIKSVGLEIAKKTIKGIANLESYNRIEISLVFNQQKAVQVQRTRSVYFSLPDLSKISFNNDLLNQ